MKLRKIIIGLSIIGLSGSSLAIIGDGRSNLPADVTLSSKGPSSTAAGDPLTSISSIRVCNFYAEPVTWTAVTDGAVKVILNDNLVLGQNRCGLIAFRGPLGEGKPIPAVTLTSTRQGTVGAATIKIMGISQWEQTTAQRMAILRYYSVDANDIRITSDVDGKATEQPLLGNTAYRSLPSGVIPQYILCNGSDLTGRQCSDAANMR